MASFADTRGPLEAFDDAGPLKPLAPEKALAHFRSLVPQLGGVVDSQLANGRPIEFVSHPSAQPDEVLVQVDPARLDQAWAKDKGYYIPPGGGGESEIGGRRDDFKNFLAKGQPIQASRVSLDPDGSVSFGDGRHRFSVLRDEGADSVGVMVPAEQLGAFRRVLDRKSVV